MCMYMCNNNNNNNPTGPEQYPPGSVPHLDPVQPPAHPNPPSGVPYMAGNWQVRPTILAGNAATNQTYNIQKKDAALKTEIACARTYTRAHIHIHTRTQTHAHTHAHTHARTHTLAHTYTHTRAHIHIHTHTRIHIYIHKHILFIT